jgi:hypothetical protein
VTSIGDIEIELVFRAAIRARMRDLVELTRAQDGSQAVILLPVKEKPQAEEDRDKRILVNIGRIDS